MRYAVIGAGSMGQEHIRHIRMLKDAAVTAVADPDDAMRAAAAELAGPGALAFTGARSVLERDLADALVIATPNHTHINVLRETLPSGLPILIEKPLCTTEADCEAALALAAGRAAPVWVAMEYRYMPPVARFLEALRSGAAGHAPLISIREHRYPFLRKVGDWNRFSRNTGGTLVEKCCHFFDLMRLACASEPARIYASAGRDVNHLDESYGGEAPDITDNALVIVDFKNGRRALLELCMFAEGSYYQEQITALGGKAKLEALVPGPAAYNADKTNRPARFAVSPRGGAPQETDMPISDELAAAGAHYGSTYYQHLRFNRAARSGGEAEVSLRDGLAAVAMGAAAELSARTGKPVEMG